MHIHYLKWVEQGTVANTRGGTVATTPKRNHQPEGLPLGREGVERAVSGEAGSIRVSISLSVLGDF